MRRPRLFAALLPLLSFAALLPLVSFAATLQAQQPADTSRATGERRIVRDSVTPEHLATAFRTTTARDLLLRARAARLEQDSTLVAYDARAVRRISAGMAVRRIGRERLLFRNDVSARVRWHADHGVWVDLTGSRTVIPMGPDGAIRVGFEGNVTPIPYFPGREELWVGGVAAREEVNEEEFVHPVARGSEAYYRYSLGDSALFTLPNGETIRLLELRVEARRPQWNLIVGSFWFDMRNAQLVRAAYRPSIPMDIVMLAERDGDNDIPRWLRPMTATIHAITVEYGLHRSEQGRTYWLPRIQAATGEAQVSFMRVPFAWEESFRYASVNSTAPFPEVPSVRIADTTRADTTGADTLTRAERRRRAREGALYDDGDATVRVGRREDISLRVHTRVPRDTMLLIESPDLPPPYDAGEELFGVAEREALMRQLGFGLQARWGPQAPSLYYGLERGMVRYNRIEGLSLGVGATMELGRGLLLDGNVRLGFADLAPNAELHAARSDGRRTIELGVYRRLVSAGDWEEPFGLGHSLNAFLFGRDEAFYHRAWGAELRGIWTDGSATSWRLFAERHDPASVETHVSVPNMISSHRFLENITAERGTTVGMSTRYLGSFGVNPRGLRTTIDARGEMGVADFGYVRGAADLTLVHPLGRRLHAAITAGVGSTAGDVPVQRLWYLGGVHSVRGQPIGTMVGDAYWLGRAELGSGFAVLRPTIFADFGWAGSRAGWDGAGIPASGVGAGLSMLDGLVRFDLSKGIRPDRNIRADLYLEARF
jgi:hypothetical protein